MLETGQISEPVNWILSCLLAHCYLWGELLMLPEIPIPQIPFSSEKAFSHNQVALVIWGKEQSRATEVSIVKIYMYEISQ